jgi:hypothetical protein
MGILFLADIRSDSPNEAAGIESVVWIELVLDGAHER